MLNMPQKCNDGVAVLLALPLLLLLLLCLLLQA
jgi:hypothetical protein